VRSRVAARRHRSGSDVAGILSGGEVA